MNRQIINLPTQAIAAATAAALALTIFGTAMRDPRASDPADLLLLAFTTLSALGIMICAKRTAATGLILAAIPLAATIIGLTAGPSILWKIQLPLALLPVAAGILISRTAALPAK